MKRFTDLNEYYEKYETVKILGKGTYGEVGIIKDKTGTNYIVKKIDTSILGPELQSAMYDTVKNEIDILKKLKDGGCGEYSPCFIKYYITRRHICLIFDIDNGSTLSEYVIKNKPNDKDLNLIFYNLISGLYKIHKAGVAHGDIKPANIIVTDDKKIKYIDFGQSCESGVLSLYRCKYPHSGTKLFMSPEMLKKSTGHQSMGDKLLLGLFGLGGSREFFMKADVWSLGKTLESVILLKNIENHKITEGDFVYVLSGLHNDQVLKALEQAALGQSPDELTPEQIASCRKVVSAINDLKNNDDKYRNGKYKKYNDFIAKFLIEDPSKRPDMRKVLDLAELELK